MWRRKGPNSRSLVGALERAMTRRGSRCGKQVRCRRPPVCRSLVDRGSCALLVILKGRIERNWALGIVKGRKINCQIITPQRRVPF